MSEREAQKIHQSLKPFLTLLFVVACLSVLASCGGGGDGGTTTTSPVVINTSGAIAFDPKNFVASQPGKSLKDSTGYINNQIWITSVHLSTEELQSIIGQYPTLKVIATRPFGRVLVEFNPQNSLDLNAITALKTTPKIGEAFFRFYIGEGVDRKKAFQDFTPPNDNNELFNDLGPNWHLEYAKLLGAWNYTTGSNSIAVAVFDGGVISNHEDLNGRITMDLANGTGANLSHGTGVVGTIAAVSNNGIGVTGINWTSKIYTNSVPDPTTQDVYANYIALLQADSAIRVINNSWCPNGDCAQADATPVLALQSVGGNVGGAIHVIDLFPNVLHVWCAGNGHVAASTHNGAIHLGAAGRKPNAIVVGAVLSDGALASYSNFGSTVDIAAPTEFRAPKLNTAGQLYYTATNRTDYGTDYSGNPSAPPAFNGTSAAAPVISGIASLVFSRNDSLTSSQVKQILVLTADRIATQRHLPTGGIVLLPSSTPIVNAAKAVQSAVQTGITSLDFVTTTPTPGTTTNFTLHTDPTTAPAQKVEVSIPGNPWVEKFNQANGIRDTSGVFQSEIYQFSVDYVFPSAGTQDVYIRTTDLLGRTTTFTKQVTITGLPVSSSLAQTALTNGLYLKFGRDNCYEKLSLGANTGANEYVMNRAKYCLQSGAWVLEPFDPGHIMLSNGTWVSFYNNLKAVFVASSPLTVKVGGEAFFSSTVSESSKSGPIGAERVIYDLSLNNTADSYQIEYDSSTNGVGGIGSIPELLTSYPVSLNGLSLLSRGQYGWAFEYTGGEPTNQVRFYDASQAPIVVSGVERRPVLASNLWNRLSFTGGNEILVLETPSGYEPFMTLRAGEKVIYAKRTADSYVREGVYAAVGTSRVWQYKNKAAVDAEMSVGGFPNTVN